MIESFCQENAAGAREGFSYCLVYEALIALDKLWGHDLWQSRPTTTKFDFLFDKHFHCNNKEEFWCDYNFTNDLWSNLGTAIAYLDTLRTRYPSLVLVYGIFFYGMHQCFLVLWYDGKMRNISHWSASEALTWTQHPITIDYQFNNK